MITLLWPHMEADVSHSLPVAEESLAVAGHYKHSKTKHGSLLDTISQAAETSPTAENPPQRNRHKWQARKCFQVLLGVESI